MNFKSLSTLLLTQALSLSILFCFLSFNAQAATQNLRAQSKSICVGKTKKLFTGKVQMNWIDVNGKGANKNTWWYKGLFATLQLNPLRANALARCRSVGTETFNITFQENNGNPTIYNQPYTVSCIQCPKKKKFGGVKHGFKKSKAAMALAKDMIEKMIEMANPELHKIFLMKHGGYLEDSLAQAMDELEMTMATLLEQGQEGEELQILDGAMSIFQMATEAIFQFSHDTELMKTVYYEIEGLVPLLSVASPAFDEFDGSDLILF